MILSITLFCVTTSSTILTNIFFFVTVLKLVLLKLVNVITYMLTNVTNIFQNLIFFTVVFAFMFITVTFQRKILAAILYGTNIFCSRMSTFHVVSSQILG